MIFSESTPPVIWTFLEQPPKDYIWKAPISFCGFELLELARNEYRQARPA
jgi:hypothetical protein